MTLYIIWMSFIAGWSSRKGNRFLLSVPRRLAVSLIRRIRLERQWHLTNVGADVCLQVIAMNNEGKAIIDHSVEQYFVGRYWRNWRAIIWLGIDLKFCFRISIWIAPYLSRVRRKFQRFWNEWRGWPFLPDSRDVQVSLQCTTSCFLD